MGGKDDAFSACRPDGVALKFGWCTLVSLKPRVVYLIRLNVISAKIRVIYHFPPKNFLVSKYFLIHLHLFNQIQIYS